MRYGYKRKRGYSGGSVLLSTIRENDKLKTKLNRQKSQRKKAREAIASVYPRGSEGSRNFYGATSQTALAPQRQIRRGLGFYGDGDYGLLGGVSRGIGALAGGAMGYMGGGIIGAAGGAESGFSKGEAFSKYMGWGDYGPVSGNQIMAGSGSQQPISVNQSTLTGDVIIEHTEFVQNITASVASAPSNSAFQSTMLPLNPGFATAFPFLSQLANNYELFEFQGLMFQYKPTSGEYGNNSSNAIGKVVMATNYDPDALPFANSIVMENYDYANSAKPSCGIIHGVETHPAQRYSKQLYVRNGATTRDKIFSDIGTFQIATEGIPFGGTGAQSGIVGELWVSYRVKLSRAQLYQTGLGNAVLQDYISSAGNVSNFVGTTTYKSTNTIGCTLSGLNATSGRINFPATITTGYYQIVAWFQYAPAGSGPYFLGLTSTNAGTFLVGSSTAAINTNTTGLTAPLVSTGSSVTNDRIMQIFNVAIYGPSATVTLSIQSNTSGANALNVWITQTDSRACLTLQ